MINLTPTKNRTDAKGRDLPSVACGQRFAILDRCRGPGDLAAEAVITLADGSTWAVRHRIAVICAELMASYMAGEIDGATMLPWVKA